MDIKDEVINNKLTYNELLELYIKYLRKKLDKQSNIPSFDKDYNYYMKNSDCNCYCYALRLKIPKYFSKAFYKTTGIVFDIDPGVFCGINDISTADKLVEALYGDLDILKIDYRKVLDNNHLYKIALYQDSFNNNIKSDKEKIIDIYVYNVSEYDTTYSITLITKKLESIGYVL